jgi:hypothetical protein
VPQGAVRGLLVLAAGKRLYGRVDPDAYADRADTERGFWVRLVELCGSHPTLPRRVGALRSADAAPTPVTAPEPS